MYSTLFGISTFFKSQQPSKALAPIDVHSDKVIFVRDVQLSKAFAPTEVHSGRFILARDVQLSKAPTPIDVHSDKIIFVRDVQPSKAFCPTVSQFARFILERLVQSENVLLPSEVQFSRLPMLERFEHPEKLLFPSVKLLSGRITAVRLSLFVILLIDYLIYLQYMKICHMKF